MKAIPMRGKLKGRRISGVSLGGTRPCEPGAAWQALAADEDAPPLSQEVRSRCTPSRLKRVRWLT